MRKISAARLALVATGLSFFLARPARAEVTLIKADGWQVTTSGRVNAFFSTAWGDGNPIAHVIPGGTAEQIPPGGGIETGYDAVPGAMNADGSVQQGKFTSMRLRNGFVPDVLSLKVKRDINDTTNLEMVSTLWATIESTNQRKTNPPYAYMQEAYGRLNGPWGSLTAGRSLDLYSRGATETDFMYGHGYGLGFGGEIDNVGPSNGLIGFGVIAAFFSAGIVYATPSLAGVQLTAGVYDPATLPGGYDGTRTPRPEAELTYDLQAGVFKMHLFGNGEFQKIYKQSSQDNATSIGVGYGGRFEVGNFHIGASGHYGKGLGLHYALEASPISVSQNFQLRTFDGYSALAQYVAGPLDINAGYGISRVFLLDSDKADPTVGLIQNQQGYFGALVYHYTPNYHLDLDYFRGHASWRFGQKQDFNFLNVGITATW